MSASSSVMAVAATAAMLVAPTCQCAQDDVGADDDASTAASDAGIEERILDFADSDNELEDVLTYEPTDRKSSQDAAIASSKMRWADLEDSEEEVVKSVMADTHRHEPAKLKWADLADSEEEQEEFASAFCEQMTSDMGAAVPTSIVEAAPAASVSQQWGDEQAKPRRRRRGQTARTSTGFGPSTSSRLLDSSSQHVVGGHCRSNLAHSTQDNSMRSSQLSATSASGWWRSESASKDWSTQQFSSKSTAKSHQVVHRGATYGAKPQCQFFIGIEEEPKFKVTRKVLGSHGKFVKAIADSTGAKLRLRGRGSGFLEGAEQLESTDELMLCVSAPNAAGYAEAVRLVRELLEGVYEEYNRFCIKSGMQTPKLEVRLHEGPRPGSR